MTYKKSYQLAFRHVRIEPLPKYSWEFCYKQALKFAISNRCRCRVYKHDRLGWLWGQVFED